MSAAASAALAFADFSSAPAESLHGLRLGRLFLLNDDLAVESARARIGKEGPKSVAKVFDGALQRDPASAYRWCDEGEALLNAGHSEPADRCYRRAADLAPKDVRILLAVGDYYSTANRTKEALQNFSPILSQTGAPNGDILTENVFTYYETMQVRQKHLLDLAIPDAPNAWAYLQRLMQNDDAGAVQQVWDWAASRHFESDRMALGFSNYMYRKQQYAAAGDAWGHHFATRNDGYPQPSRIFNGGFEHELTAGVFDWQFDTVPGVSGTRDGQVHKDGQYSWRLDFTGNNNLDFSNFKQTVFVLPGRYRFQAWVRARNITSDEGLRFRLRTARDTSALATETRAVQATSDWTLLELDVEVPAGVPLLTVSLVRHPSLRIANELNGTFWVDSVKLSPR